MKARSSSPISPSSAESVFPPLQKTLLYRPIWIFVLGLIFGLAERTLAVDLAEPFQSGMVLQQDQDHLFWGKATPGAEVAISCGDQSVTVTTDAKGRWKATLSSLKPPGPYEIQIKAENQTLILGDVLVGEVWLASGQSNMARKMKDPDVASAHEDMATARDPWLRFYTGRQNVALEPRDKREASWLACTPENAPEISALAYYFGRDLRAKLDVPVGIMISAVGGTKIESWIPLEELRKVPEAAGTLAELDRKKEIPRYEWTPAALKFTPAACYNAMIHSLVSYPLRGVIWYQGESNQAEAAYYGTLLKCLIDSWRHRWHRPDLPFVYVQLPGFKESRPDTDPKSVPASESYSLDANQPATWPLLREAQASARTIPNTAMVVTIDIGNPFNLHPDNKQEVARRLAQAALATVYKSNADYRGPELISCKIDGSEVRLEFSSTAGGLVLRGEAKAGFFLAGEDGLFHPAEARLDGATVVVNCPQISHPKYARYAWGDSPQASLFGSNGLPVAPFRTDHIIPSPH